MRVVGTNGSDAGQPPAPPQRQLLRRSPARLLAAAALLAIAALLLLLLATCEHRRLGVSCASYYTSPTLYASPSAPRLRGALPQAVRSGRFSS